MGFRKFKASVRMTSVLGEMDRLINELVKACKYLESEGHSGLVNLKSALKRARRLRNQIRKKPEDTILLRETIDAINFIVSVTKLIYSLLNLAAKHNLLRCFHFSVNFRRCLERDKKLPSIGVFGIKEASESLWIG